MYVWRCWCPPSHVPGTYEPSISHAHLVVCIRLSVFILGAASSLAARCHLSRKGFASSPPPPSPCDALFRVPANLLAAIGRERPRMRRESVQAHSFVVKLAPRAINWTKYGVEKTVDGCGTVARTPENHAKAFLSSRICDVLRFVAGHTEPAARTAARSEFSCRL